jgi:heme oxygenase (biliverdin-IX-beta and delta-forming)
MKTEDPPPPEPPQLARFLLRGCDRGVLATSLDGAPYASLVLLAVDLDASPLLLLSDLAQHTINLRRDPRMALLLDGTTGHEEPLAGPRLTVLGEARRAADRRLLARFLARHPSAAQYSGFADFGLWRVAAERGHLVAGFGRIAWIAAADLLLAGDFAGLAEAGPGIVAEANATGIFGEGWQATGVDPEGIDLRRGAATARRAFPALAATPEAARAALAELCRVNGDRDSG